MRFQVCTIITRSYLPQARVLCDSFRRFHPDVPFHVLVFDALRGEVNEPFNTLYLEDIGLPAGEETRMPMLYNVTELATALKPWFFRRILAGDKTDLLYFDPDIEIFAPVDRLAQLANEHCLVLTPHTTRPMTRENVKPNETDILSAGSFNLGFLGLGSDCGRFLDWWGERLLREAVIDIPNMRFTDQRWMDFAPGYFDTHILRDETCNVAYCNADSRPLSWTGTRYEVEGKALCFFHFSGFRPENPHLLSHFQYNRPRTRFSEHPALAQLCREYAAKLRSAGYDQLSQLPYRWGKMSNGMAITAPMRIAYRTALLEHEDKDAPAPPTAFADPASFIAWLNEPAHPRRSPEITRFLSAIHAERRDIRRAFPIVPGRDGRAYYEWLREEGRERLDIPRQLFPLLSRPAASLLPNHNTASPSRGVTLTGYLRAEAGTGEAARLMAQAVEAAGEKLMAQVWTDARSRQNHPWSNDAFTLHHDYDTNLICINADELPGFAQDAGAKFFQDRYNIGVWFWEVEVFPHRLHRAFNYVQEVWVASDFVRDAIASVSRVPVLTVPLPLNIGAPIPVAPSRAALGIPDGFMFLFCFDFFSVAERKNPVGLIEAFKHAFAPGEGPILMIKSINGDDHLDELERLYYARGDRPDIIIRDGYVNANERDELMAACDCYVSLHRSEGFGLTLAETMLLEKPVIATRYSGNLQFMTDRNSFLCGYELRLVGDNCFPYPAEARWAEPNILEAAELMLSVYRNQAEAQRRAKQARRDLCAGHDPKVAGEFMKRRLSELRGKPPAFSARNASLPERPVVERVRTALEQGVDVRRTVPSLMTWILKGPRRAMKRFLTLYDQHLRRIGLVTLDAVNEIDAESVREHEALAEKLDAQKDEIELLKRELREARQRLSAVEQDLGKQEKADPEQTVTERSADGREVRRKNGSA